MILVKIYNSVVYDKYNINLESHAGIIELDIITSE